MSDTSQTEGWWRAWKRCPRETHGDDTLSNGSALPRYLRVLAPLLLGVLIVAGCSSDDEAPPVGTVEVTVEELEGLDGGQVAGVLYRGDALAAPDVQVVGGFGVSIDEDSFSITELVRVGQDSPSASSGLFPYVTDDILSVEPGTYTLMLWAADRPLGSYSRWVPGAHASLIGCVTNLVLEEGQGASVTIVGGLGEVSTGPPTCSVA